MDLDPMKRRLVTRILAAMDTILGLCVFIIHIHRMWEYHYPNVSTHTHTHTKSDVDSNFQEPESKHTTASNVAFATVSLIIITTKVLQIFMGFGLLVATFGRNLEASIRISTWWLRTSVFIFVTLLFKLFFMITSIVDLLAELLGTGPFDYAVTIFGILFRIFSTYWVTRFIIFLQWQAEFESYCTHNAVSH